jgi:hypothetical protein
VPFGRHANEMRLRPTNVFDRLAWFGLREKAHEITRVPRPQSDADFAVMLHPANARSVACPKIENNERPLLWVDRDASGRNDFHQDVIDRLWQPPSVD